MRMSERRVEQWSLHKIPRTYIWPCELRWYSLYRNTFYPLHRAHVVCHWGIKVVFTSSSPSIHTFHKPIPSTSRSIPRIQLQINLHPITNRIIRQCKLIMERALSLPLEHDLVDRSPDFRCNHCFEHFNGVARKAGDLSFCAETVVDGYDDHGFVGRWGSSGGGSGGCRRLLIFGIAGFALALTMTVTVVV